MFLFSYSVLYLADNRSLDYWTQNSREMSVSSVTQYSYQDIEEDRVIFYFFVVNNSLSLHELSRVLYRYYPDLSCLQSIQFINLNQTFRFLHAACVIYKLKFQELLSDAENVISRFKSEFVSRYSAEYYSFYNFRKNINDVFQSKIIYHFWHVWSLTRYCGYKIQLLNNNKIVQLDTLDKDSFSLEITIYYYYYIGEQAESLQSWRKNFRYICYIISQDQKYELHCNIDIYNCSICL